MSIIKRTDRARVLRSAAFNFDDIAQQASRYLDEVRVQAQTIVAQAKVDSEQVRQQAEQRGRDAAMAELARIVDENVSKKIETLLPGLTKAISDIEDARHEWLRHWEANAVHVAVAIAERILRRELAQDTQITLTLVREALELAVGSPSVQLRVSPQDHEALGSQIEKLAEQLSRLAPTEIIADSEIQPGGCVVDTRFGRIDQRFEAQLKRIEEELI